MEKQCFFDSSMQNHAEPLCNYLKNSALDPKHVLTFHVRSPDMIEVRVFAPISHISGPKIDFLR